MSTTPMAICAAPTTASCSASQQYRAVQRALLLIWVGFFALFRRISEIVIAFELRSRQHG